jgi:hypothetical protein
MWSRIVVIVTLCISISPFSSSLAETNEREGERQAIDQMAEDVLTVLFREIDSSYAFFEEAYGYAIFDKFSLSLSKSPGGMGVLVEIDSGKRQYLDLGTGGINLGLGVRQYQAVFLFEAEDDLRAFASKGSRAESSSQGSALEPDSGDEGTFTDGVAFYYWLSDEGTVSRSGSGGPQHVGSQLTWKRRPVPTCRPRLNRRLNDD